MNIDQAIIYWWKVKYGHSETPVKISTEGKWSAWVGQDDKYSPDGAIGVIAYGETEAKALSNLLKRIRGF